MVLISEEIQILDCYGDTVVQYGHLFWGGYTHYRVINAEKQKCWQWMSMASTLCSQLYFFHLHSECLSDFLAVTCKAPGELTNGKTSWQTEDSLTFGQAIHYVCNEGYMLNGTNVTVCQENGEYDHLPPTCYGKNDAAFAWSHCPRSHPHSGLLQRCGGAVWLLWCKCVCRPCQLNKIKDTNTAFRECQPVLKAKSYCRFNSMCSDATFCAPCPRTRMRINAVCDCFVYRSWRRFEDSGWIPAVRNSTDRYWSIWWYSCMHE